MILGIAMLSVSLSVDALFVGFAFGLAGTAMPARSIYVIGLMSFIYSEAAVLAGGALGSVLPANAGRFTGAALMSLIGAAMLIKALLPAGERAGRRQKGRAPDGTICKFLIKPLNITIQILRTPGAGDMDRSGGIDAGEAVLVGSALSVDAVGAGIGSALTGLGGIAVPLCTAGCQMLFLSAGFAAGKRLHAAHSVQIRGSGNRCGRLPQAIPGVLLIALAVLRLSC
jgi:putative sporulation protein YtaF